MNNGTYFGNSSMGMGYSPDRSRDVDHYNNNRSQFLGASGSRQGGYYYSPNQSKTQGTGEWVQSGSGAWFKR